VVALAKPGQVARQTPEHRRIGIPLPLNNVEVFLSTDATQAQDIVEPGCARRKLKGLDGNNGSLLTGEERQQVVGAEGRQSLEWNIGLHVRLPLTCWISWYAVQ